MRAGHIGGSAPLAVLGVAYLPDTGLAPILDVAARAAFAALVVGASSVNDWDHSRFRDRTHPGAALVRWSCRLGYAVHTKRDRATWDEREAWLLRTTGEYDPDDMHRGPSHCLEWCALVAGLVYALASATPLLAPLAWWWALAVFVSLASHVVLDALTPSGVPISAVWNACAYGEVWRRHAFAWQWRALEVRTPGHVGRGRVGLVERDVSVPLLTVIPVDSSHEGCRPGLFYTDEAGEHLVVIPLMWLGTTVLVLGVTGYLGAAFSLLTGIGATT